MLPNLDHFHCEGDLTSIPLDPNLPISLWKKCKRALEIYLLVAAIIDTPVKIRATLLHFDGLSLQELYSNLPGAHADDTVSVDVYKIALECLDRYYFSPKQIRIYERCNIPFNETRRGGKF